MRETLKKARKAKKLTQQQMADKLRLSLRYYKSVESGERLGGIWMWDMLEDILGVNQRDLRENHPDTKDNR